MSTFDCSVNCISWAPSEYGFMLVAGLSNGNIVVISDANWTLNTLDAHKSSVNAVKFCPYIPNKKVKDDLPIMRFVS